MAQRRMFSKKVTDTDSFLDMPLSAQCLYFHLNMEADDDGFLGNSKTVRRKIGASEDDLKLLIAKGFLIPFENGVVVIKDWRIHNYIRKDTYNTTIYTDEKQQIEQDATGSYTFRRRIVDDPSPQVRLGKDRLGKDRLGKDRLNYIDPPTVGSTAKKPKPTKKAYGEFENVLLTDEEYNKLQNQFTDLAQRIERLSLYIESKGAKYKSHYATLLSWARKDTDRPPQATIPFQSQKREGIVPQWMKQQGNKPVEQNAPQNLDESEIRAEINALFENEGS